MRKERPVNLDLTTIRFPLPAIISILHRISGVLLFLFIPFMVWMLAYSLSSVQHFAQLDSWLSNVVVKFIVWVLFSALIYHLIAGIRHLLMDLHYMENLKAARASSAVVMIVAVLAIIFIGVWLFLL